MISTIYQWLTFIEENYAERIALQYVEDGEVKQITYNK